MEGKFSKRRNKDERFVKLEGQDLQNSEGF